jgi:hypothetical protein
MVHHRATKESIDEEKKKAPWRLRVFTGSDYLTSWFSKNTFFVAFMI